jgi:hypothetical protein
LGEHWVSRVKFGANLRVGLGGGVLYRLSGGEQPLGAEGCGGGGQVWQSRGQGARDLDVGLRDHLLLLVQ